DLRNWNISSADRDALVEGVKGFLKQIMDSVLEKQKQSNINAAQVQNEKRAVQKVLKDLALETRKDRRMVHIEEYSEGSPRRTVVIDSIGPEQITVMEADGRLDNISISQ